MRKSWINNWIVLAYLKSNKQNIIININIINIINYSLKCLQNLRSKWKLRQSRQNIFIRGRNIRRFPVDPWRKGMQIAIRSGQTRIRVLLPRPNESTFVWPGPLLRSKVKRLDKSVILTSGIFTAPAVGSSSRHSGGSPAMTNHSFSSGNAERIIRTVKEWNYKLNTLFCIHYYIWWSPLGPSWQIVSFFTAPCA
jgi:hypothetical protein